MTDALSLDSSLARALAEEFGTPLYVLSEAQFVGRIRNFKSALGLLARDSRVSYASKANSTLALLQIAYREGCHIDVASEGELRAALMAGTSAEDCTLHGNNKSRAEIEFAIERSIGEIVVDSSDEVERLASLPAAPETSFLLRINPVLDLSLNPKVATASKLSKFGFAPEPDVIREAVNTLGRSGRSVIGLHCHLGSQIFHPEAHARAAELLTGIMAEVPADWSLLNLGGGFAIPYTEAKAPEFGDYIARVAALPLARDLKVAFEPGRSLAGPAGVTLYRVGTIKEVSGTRLVAVDGGLADNPRPVMYDARYEVGTFRDGEKSLATVVGRHCENDVLFPDVLLPTDLQVGDLIQVFSTGAYSSSMASNYNRYPRPASVLVRNDGSVAVVQKRETYELMLEREVLI